MPKFVIRGEQKPEEIVEFWLEEDAGVVSLCAKCGGHEKMLLGISASGVLLRYESAEMPGIQTDFHGRIKEMA